MNDSQLNDRFNAVSGKLDRVLNRQAEHTQTHHDMLARLAHLERLTGARHDHLKLGKKPTKYDPRTLQFAKYVGLQLPAPLSMVDWSGGLQSWGMMLNDSLGDCTIAGCGHADTGWKIVAGHGDVILPDWVILDYYEAWDGYVAGDPNTDQGGVEIEVLNNWRKYGFGYRKNRQGANKLLAYVSVDPTVQAHVKYAVQLFGGSYIGLALPITAQGQSSWSVVGDGKTGNSAPGSWGGHCVWVVGYTPNGLTCVTWGQLMTMTWDFWAAYVDESYALLSPDFLEVNGLSPGGFDLSTLMADLKDVTA